MDDEWIQEEVNRHEGMPNSPFLRIVNYESSPEKYRTYLGKAAYERLGSPEYVQIFLSNANDNHRIKLVSCRKTMLNARPVRTIRRIRNGRLITCYYRMGGAANVVKKYKMRLGYYVLNDENIFVWKES